jgi:two-component system response regulator NreC
VGHTPTAALALAISSGDEHDDGKWRLDAIIFPAMSSRILIVDDHQMICDGLRLLLEEYPEAEVVGSCGDSESAFRMASEHRPDLVLMDVDLPDGSGIVLTRRIRESFPEVKILVLTARLEPNLVIEAIEAGASGYLEKTNASAELFAAIRTVLAGGAYLNGGTSTAQAHDLSAGADSAARVRQILPAREAQVLGLLIKGLRNKEIATELTLGVKTVETYRGRLMKRFGCASPAELVRHAIRLGLAVP